MVGGCCRRLVERRGREEAGAGAVTGRPSLADPSTQHCQETFLSLGKHFSSLADRSTFKKETISVIALLFEPCSQAEKRQSLSQTLRPSSGENFSSFADHSTLVNLWKRPFPWLHCYSHHFHKLLKTGPSPETSISHRPRNSVENVSHLMWNIPTRMVKATLFGFTFY